MDVTSSDLVKKYGENAFRDYGSHVNLAHMKSNLFDPVKYGLDPGFRLTNFTDLKGCGCKVPRDQLLKLLEGLTASPPHFAASQRELNANGVSGRHDAQNGAQSATGGSKTAFDASLSAIGEERIDIFPPIFFWIFSFNLNFSSRHRPGFLFDSTSSRGIVFGPDDGFFLSVSRRSVFDGWFFRIIWLTLLIDWLIDWLFEFPIDWLIDWLIDWVSDRLIDWWIDCAFVHRNNFTFFAFMDTYESGE